ncbi:MAG: (Fe-S)-binding protein [Proteobacteria bacterium]|nr:(Fe-S)-binding protein [Desulfobacula sp.]MBU3952763.1 (Fe-S)-binding protein [Pseudomonadota bacterium]MBU4130599.1 (Fe-S)-binding protein [Pseudomonadota bacterium]
MAQMNDLAVLVKELEEQLVTCIRCGMCQSVCPLFEQTRKEADVARGKLALLSGLMENIFEDPSGVSQRLNKCLLCGSCAANCPSGVNVLEIFIKARAILTEYTGLSPVKQLIFKRMLANPKIFDTLTQWAGRFQNLFIKDQANAQGTSCARLVSPLLAGRHVLPMAKNPFHKSLADLSRTPLAKGNKKDSGLRALFFTGCLIDKIFPNVAHASVKVLTHHGVGLSIPQGQGCCGIPALASGDRETFTRLVDHHLDLFKNEKFDVLITACATCTSTIKKLWPTLYKNPTSGVKEQLDALSQRTMDINQFLVDRVKPDFGKDAPSVSGPSGEIVTYHDPCHLKKSLGVAAQPRKIIRAAGKTLVEMEDSDKCCGMGGSFNLFHYDVSASIGNLKQKNIADTGCTTLLTGCPACMMQISDMLARNKQNIKVCHPMEVYARALEEKIK